MTPWDPIIPFALNGQRRGSPLAAIHDHFDSQTCLGAGTVHGQSLRNATEDKSSSPTRNQGLDNDHDGNPGARQANSPLSNGPENASRKKDDRLHQVQRPAHRDPNHPKRQQEKPNDRIQNQRDNRQRPAQHQKNAPQEKLCHGFSASIQNTRVGLEQFQLSPFSLFPGELPASFAPGSHSRALYLAMRARPSFAWAAFHRSGRAHGATRPPLAVASARPSAPW